MTKRGSERRLKVATFIGTRPEIIRLSQVMPLLDNHADHIIVHLLPDRTFAGGHLKPTIAELPGGGDSGGDTG